MPAGKLEDRKLEVKLDRSGRIVQNKHLAGEFYKMTFDTGECSFTRPGQFAIIEAEGIRRPFQVCEFDSNRFTIVFKADDEVGMTLARQREGSEILVQTGLGNGYDVDLIPDGTILAADEDGIPEMLGLARELLMHGKNCRLVLGYSSKKDIFMLDAFRNLVNEIEVLTLDGSNGREGSPSDAIRKADYVCASGSADMLRKLAAKTESGQFSVSCAVVIVSSDYDDCTLETVNGMVNSCDEGPVFDKNAVIWDSLS
jgi:dihydroorotate dehydrogenase electron transfer subunit